MHTTSNTVAPLPTQRRFLFLLASAREQGNTEQLARHAARCLPPGAQQVWLRLTDLAVPEFHDQRHDTRLCLRPPDRKSFPLN